MRFAAALLIVCSSIAAAQAGPPVKAALPNLTLVEATELAPHVRSIRVEPKSITLRVGETFKFGSGLHVVITDSAGHDRGRLTGYDFSIKPGEPADAVPFQITGKRPGTTEFVIHYPHSAWKARTDPRAETKVRVIVKP